jgi:hypothetical protein
MGPPLTRKTLKLGRIIRVDFQTDADLDEFGLAPKHQRLPFIRLTVITIRSGDAAFKLFRMVPN